MPSDNCNSNTYGDFQDVQTSGRLCCALELLGNLEMALQEDRKAGADQNSVGVRIAAKDFFDYLVENVNWLPTDPSVVANGQPLAYGIWRYSHCTCKNLPFQWRTCVAHAQLAPLTAVSIRVLEQASYDYWNTGDSNLTQASVDSFIEAVCCLKHHYANLKSYLH